MDNVILIPFSISALKELIEESISHAIKSYDNNKPQQQQDELLTQKQVCKLLDVSVSSIIKWKKQGLLPYHKVNSRVYYKRNEVVDAMAKFNV